MLLYVYLMFALELVSGQKQSFRGGNRYAPIPYYNLGPKPGSGVGVLQDLSNARILSNEPFIISFEFPKLIGSGDARKNRFGAKRSKSQRKKNRKPRQFRHIVVPGEEVLERRKRLEIMRRPPGLESLPNLITDEWRTGKSLMKTGDGSSPAERSNYGRLMNFEAKDKPTMQVLGEEKPVPTVNPLQEVISPREDGGEEMESDHQNNWENIKKKWISLFAKQKEGNENEVDENEERIKVLSRKMWANCQLLKLLKAPQRNPHFYKLLPPNYPALIMDEEKQLQCKEFYDITDLAKDKKMVAEKIEELERILSSGNDPGTRRKREAPQEEEQEVKAEEENTLQDETLQGKLEGEVRSDRSKRTKERQHIRRQRSKDAPKEKSRKVRRPARPSAKESRREQDDKQETTESGGVKRARRKDRINEVPTKKILEENELKPEEEAAEKKREKQEIRTGKDNSLQDVFSPSEVSKVIRQKEMEANIFDKVLRAMRKFEDNNPYDESFRPQKRESGNETESAVPQKDETGEEGWELEDTIKKLAKIFKILGVKAEAAKKKACTDCNESEESSSEESNEDGKRLKKSKPGKSPKCTCADCPFCQNCLQCFKECRKAALAAKNSLSNNQTPVSSPHVAAGKGTNGEKYFGVASDRNERERDSIGTNEENATGGERGNSVKLERMYRSKLPPSRDLVRVYFDNPENKLLVWTKRGRRTMPWGPLTSDLQLYRDRARQILKSAEDILHRIRETEDKIHTGQYDENDHGEPSDKTHKEKNMDDIIKKVVNEDETKNLLRTPWEAELEKGIVEGKILQSNQISKTFDGTTFNIFKDGIQERTELPKESLKLEVDKGNYDNEGDKPSLDGGESQESYEVGRVEAAEPKLDTQNGVDETKTFKDEVKSAHEEGNTHGELDGESVEAAVLPIAKKEEEMDHSIRMKDHDDKKNGAQIAGVKESIEKLKEREGDEEDEDIPAKVEAVNQEKVTDEVAWKIKSKVKAHRGSQRKNIVEYIKKKLKKHQNVQQTESGESEGEERNLSDASENVEKAKSDESQSVEEETSAKAEGEKKSFSDDSGAEENYAGESEEVEGSFSGESDEVGKSYSRESSVEKAYDGESHTIKGSSSVENEGVKKVNSGESDEVERTLDGESRKSGETRKAESEESEEVRKAHSHESGETRKAQSEDSGEVRKAHDENSGEVRKADSEESGETRKAHSEESEEVRKAHSDESGEEEKTYSNESETVEQAREYNGESEEVEKSAEKMIGELRKVIKKGETKAVPWKKDWQEVGDMEKKVENVMKELKEATKVDEEEKLLTKKRKEESAEIERSKYEKDESEEEPLSYEDGEQVERKGTNVEEESGEEVEETKEEIRADSLKTEMKEEKHTATEEADAKSDEKKIPFEDHIKAIEENYIIKGVKQTKEEKEAILKALLNVEKKDEKEGIEDAVMEIEGPQESAVGKGKGEGVTAEVTKSEKPLESEANSLKTVVQHLEKGHMNEDDFEVIKKLDESQVDLLVGEMQRNDEKGMSVNCETRMKLCQAVCSCRNNGTDTDLNKYEIIKGFLGWLKDINMEKMVPISV